MRLLALLWFFPFSALAVSVPTPSGTFIGTANASTGIESFLGMRYAEPPVGALRFKAPIAVESTRDAVHDATAFGSVCPQMPVAGFDPGAPQAEDCLFVNVRCLTCDCGVDVDLDVRRRYIGLWGRALMRDCPCCSGYMCVWRRHRYECRLNG